MAVLKWRQLTETNGPTNYNIIVPAPGRGMWNGGSRRHLPDASDASADTPESGHYSPIHPSPSRYYYNFFFFFGFVFFYSGWFIPLRFVKIRPESKTTPEHPAEHPDGILLVAHRCGRWPVRLARQSAKDQRRDAVPIKLFSIWWWGGGAYDNAANDACITNAFIQRSTKRLLSINQRYLLN